VQATFHDVTTTLEEHLLGEEGDAYGWDFGTGWGAPRVDLWVDTIP